MPMSDDQISSSAETGSQLLAERAALRTITDIFRILGIDITEMETLNDLRDDLRFIRRMRDGNEFRRSEITKSALAAVVGGVVGMVISAITSLATLVRHSQ